MSVFSGQPTFAAYVASWGGISLNNRELAGNDFVAIAAGGYHSLALKSNGSIVGWCENGFGQATPLAGNDFIAIEAGLYHSLALKSDHALRRY